MTSPKSESVAGAESSQSQNQSQSKNKNRHSMQQQLSIDDSSISVGTGGHNDEIRSIAAQSRPINRLQVPRLSTVESVDVTDLVAANCLAGPSCSGSQPDLSRVGHSYDPSTLKPDAGVGHSADPKSASLRAKLARFARADTMGNLRFRQMKTKLESWTQEFDNLLRDPCGIYAFAVNFNQQNCFYFSFGLVE